ncbi:YjjG family noncanonical pyrimidine nucleotidase [Pseudostreptobacillus hongkongensis]|uniref:YjjG family noncanonical pyrimidine nucleotidase n=1 Tax=Pseudostreptobacillus hongkongensis TaxID=1162717 RepID=UPI0028D4997E|nr:YjjG family noncanonical pyrimidine nucleotidase [Pseudostreptobacillus hongkongensis]
MKYKYIFFDLDNTLLDFDEAENNALNELFLNHKVENISEYMKVYKEINKQLWEKLEKNEITREFLKNTRFKTLFSTFNKEINGNEFAKEYEILLGKQGVHIDGAIELLDKLKNEGLKIYALTNGITNIQKNRLKNSKIEKYFDKVYISEEIGYQKPYIPFYNHIEKDIKGFEKSKSIMIGDSLSADIQGAINYHIDSIWYNPKNLEENLSIKPTFMVNTYSEILKILIEDKGSEF